VKDHTPAILRTYQYGDQIGTTGLAYIDQVLKPTKSPRVFNSLADAASALETHQIDAIRVGHSGWSVHGVVGIR